MIHLGRRVIAFMKRSDGSLQHKALRSGAWVGVSSLGIAVLTFARGIIQARLLSPEIFGLMAVSLSAIRLIEIFTETGFGAALIHRQQRFDDARDTAFTMMVMRGLGLSLLSLLMAPWVARFYDEPILTALVSVVGISFILTGVQNINTVALQKELDFKRLTYLDMTASTLSFVSAVALAYWLRNVWALVFAQIASAALVSVLSFVIVPGRVRLRFDFAIAKELYAYGRFITGLAIVVFLSRELDSVVIGKILGMHTLGFYVVAYSLANIPSTYLSKLVSRVLFPMFSKLQGDPERLRREYGRGIQLITAVVVPLSVAMGVLAPEIVSALYGPDWAQAAAPLRVLAVFGCFRALWMLNGYLYNAIGRPHVDFYMNLARLIVMMLSLFPLTRAYGLVGASIAVAGPMAGQFAVGIYLSRRFIGASLGLALRPLASALVQGFVLAGVLIGTRAMLTTDPRIALLCLGLIGGATAVAFNLREIRTLLAVRGAR